MFNLLLGISGISVLGYGLFTDERMWLIAGACMLGGWLFSAGIFFIKRSSIRCPLCMGPLWGNQKCQKSSKVKPALGVSYRLGMAKSIVFRGRYRCIYCGEPFDARESRKN